MGRDSAMDVQPDRTELGSGRAHIDSRSAVIVPGVACTEGRRRLAHRLAQQADDAPDVEFLAAKIEDRIPHELPRTMPGRKSSPIGLDDLGLQARQRAPVHESSAATEGDHGWRVLEQEELVRSPLKNPVARLQLRLERMAVGLRSEMPDDEGGVHGEFYTRLGTSGVVDKAIKWDSLAHSKRHTRIHRGHRYGCRHT